jgi:hypothetical protein
MGRLLRKGDGVPTLEVDRLAAAAEVAEDPPQALATRRRRERTQAVRCMAAGA